MCIRDSYVSVVNDKLRIARQRPAVGILVCGSKNGHTVRYALDGAAQPLAGDFLHL